MGSRFTARLEDDLAEWVNSEADERDRPKAWVIAEAVRAAKGDESTYAHRHGADSTATHPPDGDASDARRTGKHRSGAERTTGSDDERTGPVRDDADSTDVDDLRERVDSLEDRLAELEAREAARDDLAGERYTVDEAGARGDRGAREEEEEEEASITPGHDVQELIDDDVDPEVREAVARAAEWWDSDARAPDRVAAAVAVLSALKESEHGLTKSEIVAEFFDEYSVDGQSERTWWRRNISEGAEDEEAPAPLRLVADYSRGTHKWTWRGLEDADEE